MNSQSPVLALDTTIADSAFTSLHPPKSEEAARYIAAFQKALSCEIRAESNDALLLRLIDIKECADPESLSGRLMFEGTIEDALKTPPSTDALRGTRFIASIGDRTTLVNVEGVCGLSIRFTAPRRARRSFLSQPVLELRSENLALLQKQQFALERCATDWSHQSGHALALFSSEGSLSSLQNHPATEPAASQYHRLNPSQKEAVAKALSNSHSYIWGPPGCGKTHTLATLVEALLNRGDRILLTATTNTAVTNMLRALDSLSALAPLFGAGKLLRVGVSGEHAEAVPLTKPALHLEQRSSSKATILKKLKEHVRQLKTRLKALQQLKRQIEEQRQGLQQSLFAAKETGTLEVSEEVFSHPEQSIRKKRADTLSKDATLAFKVVERKLSRVMRALDSAKSRIPELEDSIDSEQDALLSDAHLIATTLTSLYTHPALQSFKAEYLLVDEAGMASPAQLFLAAHRSTKAIVCAGDPCQLPQVVRSKNPFAIKVLKRDIYEIALKNDSDDPRCTFLETQYRMAPDIAKIVSRSFYKGKLVTADAVLSLLPQALYFVDIGDTRCTRVPRGTSRVNKLSATCAVALIQQIASGQFLQEVTREYHTRGEALPRTALISPYAAQSRLYRTMVSELECEATRDSIDCSTVHRYQGREAPIVVVDTTDTEALGPGTLMRAASSNEDAARLLNVSVSRAQHALVILADSRMFKRAKNTPFFSSFLESFCSVATQLEIPPS